MQQPQLQLPAQQPQQIVQQIVAQVQPQQVVPQVNPVQPVNPMIQVLAPLVNNGVATLD